MYIENIFLSSNKNGIFAKYILYKKLFYAYLNLIITDKTISRVNLIISDKTKIIYIYIYTTIYTIYIYRCVGSTSEVEVILHEKISRNYSL